MSNAHAIFYDGSDYYVALNAEHARRMSAEMLGEDVENVCDFKRIPDDKILGVVDDDGNRERKTAAEWANEGKPDYLFGENY